MEPFIVKINGLNEIYSFADIIKKSFITVADQYSLTEENSPTNPAFTTLENLKVIASKSECFGVYLNNNPCGFFALEFTNERKTVYLERVCILPELRHNGFGKSILTFAENYCKNHDVETISIGVMNQNTVLKKWYQQHGYDEILIKKFPHLEFEVCFLENRLK
ncbi:MAG TPA: GNAT family N-acetyltransferase [Spirochaetota bacterium]|nr:GNAT family N-acetyltransferase [Spirochaetota bacterium]HRX46135.1 GNAT family N-acetyltransferase [Spirochaetota bacterium]